METLETSSRETMETMPHGRMLSCSTPLIQKVLCFNSKIFRSVRACGDCSPIRILGFIQGFKAHEKKILKMIKSHHDDAEKVTEEIIKDASTHAEKLRLEKELEILPQTVERQINRSNQLATRPSEYWRRSLMIYIINIKYLKKKILENQAK